MEAPQKGWEDRKELVSGWTGTVTQYVQCGVHLLVQTRLHSGLTGSSADSRISHTWKRWLLRGSRTALRRTPRLTTKTSKLHNGSMRSTQLCSGTSLDTPRWEGQRVSRAQ